LGEAAGHPPIGTVIRFKNVAHVVLIRERKYVFEVVDRYREERRHPAAVGPAQIGAVEGLIVDTVEIRTSERGIKKNKYRLDRFDAKAILTSDIVARKPSRDVVVELCNPFAFAVLTVYGLLLKLSHENIWRESILRLDRQYTGFNLEDDKCRSLSEQSVSGFITISKMWRRLESSPPLIRLFK
jgi:hypothetical protein